MQTEQIELPQEGVVRGTKPSHFIFHGRMSAPAEDLGLTSWLWVLCVRKGGPMSYSDVGV